MFVKLLYVEQCISLLIAEILAKKWGHVVFRLSVKARDYTSIGQWIGLKEMLWVLHTILSEF